MLQANARSSNVSSEDALQELSSSMSALGTQLQASLQQRVFGSMGVTMPALPTAAPKPSYAKSKSII